MSAVLRPPQAGLKIAFEAFRFFGSRMFVQSLVSLEKKAERE